MPLLDDKYKKTRGSATSNPKLKIKGASGFNSNYTQETQIESLNDLQKVKSAKIDIIKRSPNTIKGVKLITPNILTRAFILDEKQGIEGILISHHDVAGTSDVTFSLVWSEADPSELVVPITDGVIKTATVTGGSVFRIITTLIPNSSSFMLPEELISKFEFVNKKINFYATSNLEGIEMTIFTK